MTEPTVIVELPRFTPQAARPVHTPVPTAVLPAPAAPAPAPAPTAPPAPAAPVVPEPAPNPAEPPAPQPEEQPAPLNVDQPEPLTPEPPAQDEVVEYKPTGDAGLDLALGFVGSLGFRDSHPAIKAATLGDFTQLDAALKALGDKAKGYERYLTVAKDSYTRISTTRTAAAKATQDAVVKAVGGVPEWNAIHAWVKEHADDTERQQINAAFQAGGLAATAMARALSDKFKAAGLSTAKPAAARSKDAVTAPAENNGGAISKDQFSIAMKALVARYGFRAERTPEARALNQQRLAGIRAGI